MKKRILGIDLGTSGVKAGILDLDARQFVKVVLREYANSPEQDTDELYAATLDALQELVAAGENKKQIRAIALSGQMHGAVLYDAAGEIIHPLLNWQERKYSSDQTIEKMKAFLGPAGAEDTGIAMACGLTGAILFGIQEEHPDLFSRIHKFVLPTDFLRAKLLGRPHYATDPSNAFGTGLFNTRESKWHRAFIQKLGLPWTIFPEVRQTTDIAGYLHTDIANILGLAHSIPIIIGGGDNQMSILGCGLTSQGSPALVNIGTSAQISMVVSDYTRVSGVDTRSYFEGRYALVGASLAGGGSYQWLRNTIQTEKGTRISYAEMDQLAAQVPPGAEGLIFCPGPSRSTPQRDLGFHGNCKHKNSIGHRARAVMEGVLLELYALYLEMRAHDGRETMVGAGKGLQSSIVWSQIAADIFQKPIQTTNFENALFGAALMGAVGIGELENIDLGANAIQYDRLANPNPNYAAQYENEVINYWRSIVCG